ncbi:MAG: glycosyltransferase family 4 protein [Agrobacterium cavarae]|uniref:glycosyltransferase family 4 protein n=1 Tax=Agrobacterium cavarae TaxID=2528239 RepID=UPI0031ABC8E6
MISRLAFAYPGDLELKTGGYGYDREIIEGLDRLGWSIDLIPLGEGFPSPSSNVLREAERRLSALPDGMLVMIDGLAFGVMDEWAKREKTRLNIVALVHHPLALETGVGESDQMRLRHTETNALAATQHVFVTSPMTARELIENFGVPESKISVAVPGTAKPPQGHKTHNEIPQILSVGSLTRRKGHDVLIASLATIVDLSWQAMIIGSPNLDPSVASALEEQIKALGMNDRITLAGECDDLSAAYAGADIFALASRYEGYGMVFAEALSYRLPIVACHTGAVPDVVPSDAGFLGPVDDVEAMAFALRRLLIDPDERARRSEAAASAGAELPTWTDTSTIISNRLKDLI